jgi:hypothetical protein
MLNVTLFLERIPGADELRTALGALTGAAPDSIFFSSALDPWWNHETEIDAGEMRYAVETWVQGGEFPFSFELLDLQPSNAPAPHTLEYAAQLAELIGCAVLLSDCTSNPYRYVWIGGYNHIMTVAVAERESRMGTDLYLQYAAPTLYINGDVPHRDFLTAIISVFRIRPEQLRIAYAAPTRRRPVVVYPRPKTTASTPYFQPVLFVPQLANRVAGDIDLALKLAARLATDIWVNLHQCDASLMLAVQPNGHTRRARVEIDGDWDDVRGLRVLHFLDD